MPADHPPSALPPFGLPIDPVLPALVAALARHGRAVLQAPPGAGKTTRVPLALLAAGATGRILMLEPRRLAARTAAERMAETLGEPVGKTVGFRIRGAAQVSGDTRIEVVTEGILTRMIQADPELSGVGTVIFDEFHERALAADLGLALAWEARGALRPDLQLLVMSATLDAAPVAALLEDAPILTAEGRSFPVETRWLERPARAGAPLAPAVAALVAQALDETTGGVLVFLPGAREIGQVARLIEGRAPGLLVLPLHGRLPFSAQRTALAPPPAGTRKVVLATSIAETSLTIPDIRVVVDAGRARRARFDPNTGMSQLVTERASRAEADQRRGRAGRVGPGVCYRNWARAEEGAMPAFAPPEIETGDLAPLALDLAAWGCENPADLAFLTLPPEGPLAAARALLADLGALDGAGRITAHGRAMAALPVHPRLAHMLAVAGADAAPLAALLGARDPLAGQESDLARRLRALAAPRALPPGADRGALAEIAAEARRLARLVPRRRTELGPGAMAALAFPDRIAKRRPGDAPRFVLSGGRGAELAGEDGLAARPFLVAAELDGAGREARIRRAIALDEAELRDLMGGQIAWVESCAWSRRTGRVEARRQERLGALVLSEAPWQAAPPEAMARAFLEGVRLHGLPWSPPARRLQARVETLRAGGAAGLPDFSEAGLLATLESWLAPFVGGLRTREDMAGLDLFPALEARLGWEGRALLDRLAPAHFITPLGRQVAIEYTEAGPEAALRLQEVFGLSTHPVIGPARLPIRLVLLSPAGRPLQVTTDLPGFWAGAYEEVRKEMRGRYPRHAWPENPAEAAPTLRAKPRGS